MDIQHYFDLLREIRDTAMATVAEDGKAVFSDSQGKGFLP